MWNFPPTCYTNHAPSLPDRWIFILSCSVIEQVETGSLMDTLYIMNFTECFDFISFLIFTILFVPTLELRNVNSYPGNIGHGLTKNVFVWFCPPCFFPDRNVLTCSHPGAGFTNFTKFLIRILLSFYHVAQAPRRTLVGLYQHIPTNSVGESGHRAAASLTNRILSHPARDGKNQLAIINAIYAFLWNAPLFDWCHVLLCQQKQHNMQHARPHSEIGSKSTQGQT
jgi:hypothetical protein